MPPKTARGPKKRPSQENKVRIAKTSRLTGVGGAGLDVAEWKVERTPTKVRNVEIHLCITHAPIHNSMRIVSRLACCNCSLLCARATKNFCLASSLVGVKGNAMHWTVVILQIRRCRGGPEIIHVGKSNLKQGIPQ